MFEKAAWSAPALGGVALLLLVTWLSASAGMELTGGQFSYCLDDAYIHLAIAKNLALHHVWGATRFEFSSASSSPLWTLLLTLGTIVMRAPREWLPFAFALPCAAAVVAISSRRWMRGPDFPRRAMLCFLLAAALVLLAPLPALVLSGMEHPLQIALVIAYAFELEAVLLEHERTLVPLALLGALASACRYESLMLIAPASLLLLARGRLRAALVGGGAGLLPAIAFGLFSIAHGSEALPNSVLLKAGAPHLLRGLQTLRSAPHLVAALIALAGVVALLHRVGTAKALALRDVCAAVCAALLLHVQFARVGWFFRYEAWLLALAIALVGAAALDHAEELRIYFARTRFVPIAAFLALVALLVAPSARAARALRDTPRAMRNIVDQQRQVGLFLGALPGRSLALNDIGCAAYFADVRILDLAGLASIDVARAIRAHDVSPERLDGLIRGHGVEFALLHEKLFHAALPRAWVLVARWRAPDNYLLGEDTVSLFAADAQRAAELRAHVVQFLPQLPGEDDVWLNPE